MKKRIHPQMQWTSFVTHTGMTRIHRDPKVFHFRAKKQMAQSLGQIAKFKRRHGLTDETTQDNKDKDTK